MMYNEKHSMNEHKKYMQKAIALAKKGGNAVYPNPKVGAVIVKDDEIIAQGWHAQYGQQHAEKIAIDRALKKSNVFSFSRMSPVMPKIMDGAILYCTLEPCCAVWKGKKQPACTDTIIASGIKKVVVGMIDPNKNMQGKGIVLLQKAGIEVIVLDILQKELVELNEVFIALQQKKHPFVHAKIAQSIDARIASLSGDSQWITGEASRAVVHRIIRKHAQAIITGVNTILKDNPRFDVRLKNSSNDISKASNNPLLVILDTTLKTPVHARMFDIARRQSPGVIIFCAKQYVHQKKKKAQALEACGAKIITQERDTKQHIDLHHVLDVLYSLSCYSVLLESGATLLSSFFSMGLIDKISVFIAPKIIGGTQHSSFQIQGITTMKEVSSLYTVNTRSIANADGTEDLLISGYTKKYFQCYGKQRII